MKIYGDLYLDIGTFCEGLALRRLKDENGDVQMVHFNYGEAEILKNALEQAIVTATRNRSAGKGKL